ncbi:ATP-binding cassette transporter ABC1 [Xylona heveae TC161]|uniref:ATP-binding cassette transporter ABC1 n=1 Tax=Xylona heveae (strain CBS 132557 / TC161) TaxID=1328760 RepID=A0A164ZE13_XYLHT|nr:ATP-binding cassette transporter ABC1 [Xylona heveae TC161]KZF18984.1 ATP-binding cassette transporter ABC1 [Xylona heveae TC161]
MDGGKAPNVTFESGSSDSPPQGSQIEDRPPEDARRENNFGSIYTDDQSVLSSTPTRTSSTAGQPRRDSISDIRPGDPEVDPANPAFDVYKWAKWLIRLYETEGIQRSHAGIVVRDLDVSGTGSSVQLQETVSSAIWTLFTFWRDLGRKKGPAKKILRNCYSLLKSGETLLVLGRPGSGCSTFLKTMTGELDGLEVAGKSSIHYSGIPQHVMTKEFKGDIIYNQEVDNHFPYLTVGQTMEFAAAVTTPHNRPLGVSRKIYTQHIAQAMMVIFGLSHTYNTKVGNDFVRGVSGGERKRVSIAEMSVRGAVFSCWDNSTRGLDAATALEFVQALTLDANVAGNCHCVAIYQASQAIYNTFDRVTILYEGRQIYFGPTDNAKRYFEEMGWSCPPRQTTPDFLTSITNPDGRTPRAGYESRVPRSAKEFERYWHSSAEFSALRRQIDEHERKFRIGGRLVDEFRAYKRSMQSKYVRKGSSCLSSIPRQIFLCTIRAYQRLWNDQSGTITIILYQICMSLVVGSVYFDTPATTAGLFAKGSVLFYAILLNSLLPITEINRLYDQRPIVQKHASYAFYHPFVEALAGVVADIPVKFIVSTFFNIIIYFLSSLRREPSQFFIFFLFNFLVLLTMSAIYRTVAASTKTLSEAFAISGILVLVIGMYTGFTIPRPYMPPWFEWIYYLNPVAYAFEAVLVNELHGRYFGCSQFVPSYPDLSGDAFICAVTGARPGDRSVSGDAFALASYGYRYSHLWRNLGIIIAFEAAFLGSYLVASEFNSLPPSKVQSLIFRRGYAPKPVSTKEVERGDVDEEPVQTTNFHEPEQLGAPAVGEVSQGSSHKDVFSWRNLHYDIVIKGEPRKLLDNVAGYIKPGTLTALMGVSGAGKTTLLDVLARRTSVGVVTGDILINGKPTDASFQRRTGYVQQQDVHLETSTVREALRFSALLRQPKTVSKKEKYDHVEDVIRMLQMGDFAESVVGGPGEGLNVLQRKLLTIGVELTAKPSLLIFLDEPTSGLDSDSAWEIIAFLRRLADGGQSILSTIHQPSSILFQEFDRLLFLAKGGRTVYFGDIGSNSETLLKYFFSHGGRECGQGENPAEYMLEIIGAGTTGKSIQDWPTIWNESAEAQNLQRELDALHKASSGDNQIKGDGNSGEFAMPFISQLWHVTLRVFQAYWRTPSYIWGKFMLILISSLFIGFTFFDSTTSVQGMQNVIFSVLMLTSVLTVLVEQIMPRFVSQRLLYEVRERPSKTYSWSAFITANILVEIPYQILVAIIVFATFYYPVFGVQSSERQGLILFFCINLFIFASTFAQLVITVLPDAETAGNIATLLLSLTLTFNGVMQPPSALPGFWIFMYWASPMTYFVSGVVSTGLHSRPVKCSAAELSVFNPPAGRTCGEYLAKFLETAPGYLENHLATNTCRYCRFQNADQFIGLSWMKWSLRWRNFGILWIYVAFNIVMAAFLYWAFRVRGWSWASTKKIPSRIVGNLGFVGYWLRVLFNRGEKNQKSQDAEEGV